MNRVTMTERPEWVEEARQRDRAKGHSKAGITMTPAEADRRRLLAYVDTLTRQLEDKADEYDTLRAEFEQQRELCAEHSVEFAAMEVRAKDAERLLAGAVAANRLEQDAVRAVAAERDAALEANRAMREAAKKRRAETLQLTHAPGACPTLCDDDCDAACHEEHEVPAKRLHQPPPGTAEFRWGESVSWTEPGTATIPLTYGANWTADLVLRGVAETRVLVDMLADTLNQPQCTGCCAKDGIDCVSCMTGRCYECTECVHYDDSAHDRDHDGRRCDNDED